MTARLNGQEVRLLVDTGAGISVIDEHFLTELYGGILPALHTSSSSQVKTVSESCTSSRKHESYFTNRRRRLL